MLTTLNKRRADCEQLAQIAPIDLAWLVGLYEGEGSFCVSNVKQYRNVRIFKPVFRVEKQLVSIFRQVIATIAMTDRDVMARVAKLVNQKLNGPYFNGGPHNKAIWMVTLSGAKASAFCDLIYPFMGNRRQAQINKLRLAYKDRTVLANAAVTHTRFIQQRQNGHKDIPDVFM